MKKFYSLFNQDILPISSLNWESKQGNIRENIQKIFTNPLHMCPLGLHRTSWAVPLRQI